MHSNMWSKAGYMGIKLDMSKAYDKVEWYFLEAIMKKLGFAEKWLNIGYDLCYISIACHID